MNTGNNARRRFCEEILPQEILHDPTPFYEAFEEGEDELISYLTALWMDENVSDTPFFPEVSPFILEDTADGFSALLLIRLSPNAAAAECFAAVVFGSDMDPRVFAALPNTLPKGDTLAVCEIKADGVRAIDALYQGCDNNMQLFDPPSPLAVDRDKPLPAARRADAAVEQIVAYCLDHD